MDEDNVPSFQPNVLLILWVSGCPMQLCSCFGKHALTQWIYYSLDDEETSGGVFILEVLEEGVTGFK